MKVLLTVAAFAALVATPALAQTYHTRAWGPGYDSYDAAPAPDYNARGLNAYDQYSGPAGYVVGNSPVVTFEGKIVGQDPDINVRQQLERDPGGVAQ